VSARYEHFPHEADVGLRGIGASPAEAFAGAALALTAAVAEPDLVRHETPVAVECRADSLDDLLYDWLNALVFEMATRRMLFGRFDVRIDGGVLNATAWGETISVARHQPAVEPKGATYTGLRVFEDTRGWVAECIVDV
jgi:SHS2 domain-containing protein